MLYKFKYYAEMIIKKHILGKLLSMYWDVGSQVLSNYLYRTPIVHYLFCSECIPTGIKLPLRASFWWAWRVASHTDGDWVNSVTTHTVEQVSTPLAPSAVCVYRSIITALPDRAGHSCVYSRSNCFWSQCYSTLYISSYSNLLLRKGPGEIHILTIYWWFG